MNIIRKIAEQIAELWKKSFLGQHSSFVGLVVAGAALIFVSAVYATNPDAGYVVLLIGFCSVAAGLLLLAISGVKQIIDNNKAKRSELKAKVEANGYNLNGTFD